MRLLPLVAAAIAAGVATPVLASSQAAASLLSFNFQLVDLDLGDGVAPWISFAAPDNNGSSASLSLNEPNAYANMGRTGTEPWQSVAVSAALDVVGAEARLTAGPLGAPQGASMSASGWVQDFASSGYYDTASFWATAQAPSGWDSNFSLSANTLLVVQAMGSLDVSAYVAPTSSYYGYANAYAYADLQVTGPGAGGAGYQTSTDSLGVDVYAYAGYGQQTNNASRLLTVSFVNLTQAELSGNLTAYVSTSGYSYATPVPESGTGALWLAGLGIVGAVARRRVQV